MAWSEAINAYWVNRSILFSSFRPKIGEGSYCLTSQAKVVLNLAASKCVISPAPILPTVRFFQNAFT